MSLTELQSASTRADQPSVCPTCLNRHVVTRPGRTRAEALHNLRAALDALGRAQKALPLSLLHCEYELLHGDPRVIVPLLLAVRRSYGHDRAPSEPRASSRERARAARDDDDDGDVE